MSFRRLASATVLTLALGSGPALGQGAPGPRPIVPPLPPVAQQGESGAFPAPPNPAAAEARLQEEVGTIQIPDLTTVEVLDMLENFTGKPILRQQNLPLVRVSFSSQRPLTRGEAITAIESVLVLNGIAITEVGDEFLKAVPAPLAGQQVPPLWVGTTLNAPPSQKIYEKLFQLDVLNVQEALPTIQPLMSQGAPIPFARNNMLLIADSLINLQRLERLFEVLDRPPPLRTAILYFELRNIGAEPAAQRLQFITDGPLFAQLQGNTTFSADERTNQLFVFTHPSNETLIRQLVEKLDADVAPVTATKVFSIRYAEAAEVVTIIDEVASGQRKAGGGDAPQGGNQQNAAAARRAAQRAQQVAQQNQAAAQARATASNLQFSSFLTLVADERANTIVAYGTPSDLEALANLIDQIDVLLAQVRIEVVIAEVTLSKGYARGIDQLGLTLNTRAAAGTPPTTPTGQIPVTYPTTGSGPANDIVLQPGFGNEFSISPIIFNNGEDILKIVLGQGSRDGDTRILSAPTIVTTHNREATITVGDSIPITTTSITTDTGNADNVRRNVQYVDTGVQVNVTPIIGSDGVVQLEIEQQVETPGTPAVEGENPPISQRNTSSYVSVGDGQLVVLGGLQRQNDTTSRSRMFLLGDIPLLGELFTRRTVDHSTTELLIFVRPTILKTVADVNADAEREISRQTGENQLRSYLDTGSFVPPPPPPAPKEDEPTRGPRR